MRKGWVLLWGLLVIGGSGCSITPEISDQEGLESASSLILNDHAWSLRGRLAIVKNNAAESVRIKWQHWPDSEKLAVYGPLGRQLVVIVLEGRSVVIDYGADNKRILQDVTKGVDFGLGFEVPILAFRYWLLGLPAPGNQFVYVPEGFIQQGWRVFISKVVKVEQYSLPKKVQLSYGDVKLKLLVDQWQLM
ncbi:MAG TPA: outer membrane lipoprotein LolB [Methylococcaceae bacterium]|jgi:outer membrane lipoprotein LolB|nr:outer membrane lipoprotein LolB [Methylococcaceae bacterium]HIA45758.1 outer membrane lipoprotein LolB [Methylococcaceae bacterium]HIN68584.1 outer membrane lipoprotein LolB [Methylococcales bacterium]